jgi:hypothetical protein
MRKNIIFIIVLITIVLHSGCVGQDGKDGGPVYSDDALALLDYKTNTRVYHNEETSIEFWLTNQVEWDIRNVNVKLFNPNVFTVTKIICENKENIGGNSCYFDKIPTTEARRVRIFLKAPSKEEIGTLENSYKVDLSVKYDYDGESFCNFRILSLEKENTETKIQLTQTTGPVKVKIEPSFLIEEKTDQGTKTISDWTVEGKPFNIKISNENVGSLGSDYEFPKISLSDFKMYLENVRLRSEDKGSCDFDWFNGDDRILTKDGIIVPTEKPLSCILIPNETIDQPEVPGMIRIQYSYTYEFIKSENFKIETF